MNDFANVIVDYLPCHTLGEFLELLPAATRKRIKSEFITKNFYPQIIELLGGLEKCVNYPFLEFKDEFMGCTDYIDKIKPRDVCAPIMLGIDSMSRAFVTIRTIYGNNCVVDTIFQRYPNNKKIWTNGCYGYGMITSPGYFYTFDHFNPTVVENITNLIQGRNYVKRYSFRDKCNKEVPAYLV